MKTKFIHTIQILKLNSADDQLGEYGPFRDVDEIYHRLKWNFLDYIIKDNPEIANKEYVIRGDIDGIYGEEGTEKETSSFFELDGGFIINADDSEVFALFTISYIKKEKLIIVNIYYFKDDEYNEKNEKLMQMIDYLYTFEIREFLIKYSLIPNLDMVEIFKDEYVSRKK